MYIYLKIFDFWYIKIILWMEDVIEFICNVLQKITNLSYFSLMVILKQRGRQRR